MFVGIEKKPCDKRALADTMGQSRTIYRRSARPVAGRERGDEVTLQAGEIGGVGEYNMPTVVFCIAHVLFAFLCIRCLGRTVRNK